MPTDSVLLDTTVQLWRIAYGPEEAAKFQRELDEKAGVYTTSFVFREFLNTIIGDLEYVHIQTSEILEPDEDGRAGLGRLVRFFAIGEGDYSQRSIRRLHLVTAELLDSFEHTRVPKKKILVRLERTARRWIRDFFRSSSRHGGQDSIICLTALDDSPDELEKMRHTRPFPPRPSFPKAVAGFLEDRRERVVRVEEEMRKTTKAKGRDDKLLTALKWLKDKDGRFDFHGRLRDYRVWNWRLGDLLIALETPEDVAIYSSDHAFVVLTRALGKPRHRGYRVPA